MKQLRPYQQKAIDSIARLYGEGVQNIVFQLATGGGKTVSFAGLVNRYMQRQKRRVLIVVHRDELLKQARRTLYDWHGIIAEPIIAGVRVCPMSQVMIGMVETVNNRLKKNENWFGDVGLLIIDECHLGNFRKLHPYFSSALTIGFTATPISASKKQPLKDDFQGIVCGIDIPELIDQGALVPNRTYHIKNINRKSLTIKNGEFDDRIMGEKMSGTKHVANCIKGYTQHGLNTKTLIFNCNVAHSKVVCAAFLAAGYGARHVDGTASPTERSDALKWFEETPNAILNNVGILTTGFDSPATQTVIVNRATMSLPLWLQMTGRGSRPYAGKPYFTIIDMGGNALYHGDWCAARDWADIFHDPEPPGPSGGVAPVKCCVSCEAIIHASVRVCPFCGALNEQVATYDDIDAEFEMLTTSRPLQVDVAATIKASEGKNPYYALHQIKHTIIGTALYQWKVKTMSDGMAYKLLEMYQGKVKEWCKANGKKYNEWHKTVSATWFFDELKKKYKWEPTALPVVA